MSIHLEDSEPAGASERCPECRRTLYALGSARSCWWCGYHRPAPAPGSDVLGILGRGQYQRLGPRLRRLARRLQLGLIVGQTINWDLTVALACDMRANAGCVLEHWKVIDEATHVILLGEWAPEIEGSVRAKGKALRQIRRGRFVPPAGGWPKRPKQVELPPFELLEELDAGWISPFLEEPGRPGCEE